MTPKDEMDDSNLISLREAAERLGVHYMTAYKYVRSGRLRASKSGDEWIVRLADIDVVKPGRQKDSSGTRGRPTRREVATPRLEDRMMAGDEPGAWAVIEAAMHSGASPTDIYLEILGPALRSIGEKWAAGAIDVADEHRASAVAMRLVGRLGPRFLHPGKPRGSIVIGAAAGDDHGLPTALLADLLRAEHYAVTDLGANTPPASFVHAIIGVDKLVAVGICATVPDGLAGAKSAVAALRKAAWTGPIFVGGGAVDSRETAVALGASHWEHDVVSLLQTIKSLRAPSTVTRDSA